MINCHSTATCPSCNKDSWASEAKAFFSTATCAWCKCEFKWDTDSKSYKIVMKGKK